MLPDYLYLYSCLTGSTYVCNPPVTTTDIDFMYLVYDLEETTSYLKTQGWTMCGVNEYTGKNISQWSAFRKGKINLLITDNSDYFDKFEAATELAKKRNLLNKRDRIRLFGIILGEMHNKPQSLLEWPEPIATTTINVPQTTEAFPF